MRSKYFVTFLFLFTLFSIQSISAQDEKEDLLAKVRRSKNDSVKAINIYRLLTSFYKTYPDSAIGWARTGITLIKDRYPFVTADFLNVIGIVYKNTGALDSAIIYQMKALHIKEQLKDSIGISNGLSNIGQIYNKMKNYKKAEKYYFEGLAFRLAKKDSLGIAGSYNNIGVMYEEEKLFDKALEYYSKALEIKKKLGNKRSIAATMANLGVMNARMKNYDRAIELLTECLDIYSTLRSDVDILVIRANLGDSWNRKKNFKKAFFYLKDGVEPALKTGNAELIGSYYNGLANTYEGLKENEKALKYFRLYKRHSDSLFTEKNSSMVTELEGKYSSEKKDNEIKLLNKEKKISEIELDHKRSQTLFFVAIAFVFLALLVIVIRNNIRRKKDNVLLQKLNTEITQSHNEIEHQKEIVEEKQKEILDSINYAKRIQLTLLAHKEMLDENLGDHFVMFRPKDIVSGDFYWATKKDDLFFLAVCDSTGHGVPGAFMCLLNIGFLSEAINENHIHEPNKVLDYVRERLIRSISKEGQKDGFDGILACFDKKTGKITYAAANNSPVIVQSGQYTELPGDRMPVGKGERPDSFKLFEVNYQKGDTLYLYTDGYADQFGGPKGKKFMYKRLNTLAADVSTLSISDQQVKLEGEFNQWKGNLEQIDDVCMIGIKL